MKIFKDCVGIYEARSRLELEDNMYQCKNEKGPAQSVRTYRKDIRCTINKDI